MPSLDDVYRKFGEVSEAAQLLETQLGNILLLARGNEQDLFTAQNPELARRILDGINKSTLGQLLKQLHPVMGSEQDLERLLVEALDARNRLAHTYYREHNLRRNTEEGRAIMITDLESLHGTLIEAYRAALTLSGVDLDAVDIARPKRHLPIR